MTNDTYAREVIRAGRDRGITDHGIVIAFATVHVESNWLNWANSKVPESLALPHDAVGADGKSVGLFQQQVVWGNGAWWWGDAATCMDPYKSAVLFYQRLKNLPYQSATSNTAAGAIAQQIQQSAYPDRYAQRMDEARAYFQRLNTGGSTMGWTGDPTWLEEVLQKDLGDRLVVHDGWQSRGTGMGVNGTDQMGDIWGVMMHHTGNSNETPEAIRDGVWQTPDYFLPGPLSQCLITPDGKCHLVAIGPCNHAGTGSYPGIPAGQGNQHLIGIECAWPTVRGDGTYDANERWPDGQIITMRDAAAAIIKRLGYRSDRVIAHHEWAGAAQGKWDPGNLDMDWFRGEVQKDIDGFVFPGEAVTTPPPERKFPDDYSDRELLLWIIEQLGVGHPAWKSKGMTLRDKVWSLGESA